MNPIILVLGGVAVLGVVGYKLATSRSRTQQFFDADLSRRVIRGGKGFKKELAQEIVGQSSTKTQLKRLGADEGGDADLDFFGFSNKQQLREHQRIAIWWTISVLRLMEKFGVFKIPWVLKTASEQLTGSSLHLLQSIGKGALDGANFGPAGAAAGAFLGFIRAGIENAAKEEEIRQGRNSLAEAFMGIMKVVGPPPIGVLAYASSAKIASPEQQAPESWCNYIVQIVADMQERQWNVASLDPQKTGKYYKWGAVDPKKHHLVCDGEWGQLKAKMATGNSNKPNQGITWILWGLHFDYMFSDLMIPTLPKSSKFAEEASKFFAGRSEQKLELQFFDFDGREFRHILRQCGLDKEPNAMMFRVGVDPGTIKELDLLDITDLFNFTGGGSIQVRQDAWQVVLTIYTGFEDTNWLLTSFETYEERLKRIGKK